MARKKGKGEVPAFWIIAGPNGSGKSTLYGSRRDAVYGNTIISDATRPFWIINPPLESVQRNVAALLTLISRQ
jgi:predicted ABC-type ATPase